MSNELEKAKSLYSDDKFLECAKFCRESSNPNLKPVLVQTLYKLADYDAASKLMEEILDPNNETHVVNWMALKILSNDRQPIIQRYASDVSSCQSSYQQMFNVSCALYPDPQHLIFAQASKDACIKEMETDEYNEEDVSHELFPIQVQLSQPFTPYSESSHDIQTNWTVYCNSIINAVNADPSVHNITMLQSITSFSSTQVPIHTFKSSEKIIEGLHTLNLKQVRKTRRKAKIIAKVHNKPPMSWKKVVRKVKKSKNTEYRHQGEADVAESKSGKIRSTASLKAVSGSSNRRRR